MSHFQHGRPPRESELATKETAEFWVDRLKRSNTREAARRALLAMGDDAVPSVFRAFGSSRSREESDAVASVLVALGGRAADLLIEGVYRRSDEPLISYATALGAMRDDRAVPALILLTKNKDPLTRWSAVTALATFARPDTIDLLVARLRDRSSFVASVAARALGKFGDARAIPELARLISKPSIKRYPGIVTAGIRAIEAIREREARKGAR